MLLDRGRASLEARFVFHESILCVGRLVQWPTQFDEGISKIHFEQNPTLLEKWRAAEPVREKCTVKRSQVLVQRLRRVSFLQYGLSSPRYWTAML